MVSYAIRVENLKKEFKSKKAKSGFMGNLSQFLRPEYERVEAVKGINFEVLRGERIAFIGPNGAGKSTTIKMMSGILLPSHGDINVLGLTPWKERTKLGYRIGTVFGQKSQLWYHLPAKDTFDLLARIYGLELSSYKKRLQHLVKLFGIEDFIGQTVRKLSLGQRMRCEIVASILHKPEILFLDEPTIGLDVTAKSIIRDLIKEQSEVDGTTIFLTSHDTADMERVCERVMVINFGDLIIDSKLTELRENYIQKKVITFLTEEESIDLSLPGVTTIEASPYKSQFEVMIDKSPVDTVIVEALKKTRLKDITVEDPPLDEIVQDIYQQEESMR